MLVIEDTSTPYLIGARDCYIPGDPLSYTGTLAVMKIGIECLYWTDPRAVDTLARETSNPVFPETDIANAANYCRDPTEFGNPWCVIEAGRFFCDVPMCPPEGRYTNEVSVYDNISHTYNLSRLKIYLSIPTSEYIFTEIRLCKYAVDVSYIGN